MSAMNELRCVGMKNAKNAEGRARREAGPARGKNKTDKMKQERQPSDDYEYFFDLATKIRTSGLWFRLSFGAMNSTTANFSCIAFSN